MSSKRESKRCYRPPHLERPVKSSTHAWASNHVRRGYLRERSPSEEVTLNYQVICLCVVQLLCRGTTWSNEHLELVQHSGSTSPRQGGLRLPSSCAVPFTRYIFWSRLARARPVRRRCVVYHIVSWLIVMHHALAGHSSLVFEGFRGHYK